MRVIAHQFKVLVFKVEEVLHVRVQNHLWQWTRLACQLQLRLLDMVQVQVRIACGVDKVTSLKARHLRHHL